jgi:hypothetical protein
VHECPRVGVHLSISNAALQIVAEPGKGGDHTEAAVSYVVP